MEAKREFYVRNKRAAFAAALAQVKQEAAALGNEFEGVIVRRYDGMTGATVKWAAYKRFPKHLGCLGASVRVHRSWDYDRCREVIKSAGEIRFESVW